MHFLCNSLIISCCIFSYFLTILVEYAIKHKKKDFCYAHTIAYAYIRNARKRAHVRIRKQKKDHFRRNDLFLSVALCRQTLRRR